jgi:anti-sigma B factor antagonist
VFAGSGAPPDVNGLAQLSLVGDGEIPVARIEGAIDISNARELGDALLEIGSESAIGLVVDLSAVNYLDSAGVRLILRLANELDKRGRLLRVVGPADAPVRSVLELTAVDRYVPLYDRVEDAVAAARARAAGRSPGRVVHRARD